jgi:hypothetical protein
VTVDAVAVRFQLLSDVLDISYILAFSGFGGLVAAIVAAALRFRPERLARLVLFGNLFGAAVGCVLFLLGAVGVIS